MCRASRDGKRTPAGVRSSSSSISGFNNHGKFPYLGREILGSVSSDICHFDADMKRQSRWFHILSLYHRILFIEMTVALVCSCSHSVPNTTRDRLFEAALRNCDACLDAFAHPLPRKFYIRRSAVVDKISCEDGTYQPVILPSPGPSIQWGIDI